MSTKFKITKDSTVKYLRIVNKIHTSRKCITKIEWAHFLNKSKYEVKCRNKYYKSESRRTIAIHLVLNVHH